MKQLGSSGGQRVTYPLWLPGRQQSEGKGLFVANHRAERRPRRRASGGQAPAPTAHGSHRGNHRDDSCLPSAPAAKPVGARRASHSGTRKKLVPTLPSVPTLAGAAVVALAATGALTFSQNPLTNVHSGALTQLSAHANLSRGHRAPSARRRQQTSRDAARPPIQDAQDRQLVAAADAQAQERTATLDALAARAQRHAASLVWHLPVARGSYHLTARFGEVSGLWAHTHTGLDFAGPVGTPIMAVAGGVITSTGWGGAYGNRTVETLPDGTELWYCHQNAFKVQPGQRVAPGQVIGYIGATGNVTGPHLHLEVRPTPDTPVDPFTALVDHGVHP